MKLKVTTNKDGQPVAAFSYIHSAKAMVRQGALGFILANFADPFSYHFFNVHIQITIGLKIAFTIFMAMGGSIEELLAFLRNKPALDLMAKTQAEQNDKPNGGE